MSDFHGYDYSRAKCELRDAIQAVRELLAIVCGDKYKALAGQTGNLLFRKAYNLEEAFDKILGARKFSDDFEKYIELNCKSLAEAKRLLAKANAGYKNDSELKTDTDFNIWKERISQL